MPCCPLPLLELLPRPCHRREGARRAAPHQSQLNDVQRPLQRPHMIEGPSLSCFRPREAAKPVSLTSVEDPVRLADMARSAIVGCAVNNTNTGGKGQPLQRYLSPLSPASLVLLSSPLFTHTPKHAEWEEQGRTGWLCWHNHSLCRSLPALLSPLSYPLPSLASSVVPTSSMGTEETMREGPEPSVHPSKPRQA